MACKHKKWRIVRTIWPYEYGWCWQCKRCKMAIDFVKDCNFGDDKNKSKAALEAQGPPT